MTWWLYDGARIAVWRFEEENAKATVVFMTPFFGWELERKDSFRLLVQSLFLFHTVIP